MTPSASEPSQAGPTASGSRQEHRARKSLGQHFLADRNILRRIIEAADLSQSEMVVEIGPGRGALTTELAARAGRVVAVELDHDLATGLESKLGHLDNLEVVCADARDIELESLVPTGTAYKVVANLPYYAASPIVRRFLEAESKPEIMVVMLQREVAREMAASEKLSILSVAVQLYGRTRIVTSVPPRAFRPAPNVTSAVVRIDVYPTPALGLDSEQRFFRLVRAGFNAPRKQLHNNLKAGLSATAPEVSSILLQAGIDPMRRAETLTIEDWGRLYHAWRSEAPEGPGTSGGAA